jgi:hypothetical protein
MSIFDIRPRVCVEAKADARLLGKLIDEMRACHAANGALAHQEHPKCRATEVLRPRFFLGVAAGDTWRLFNVTERDGRAALGDELFDLGRLEFRP